MLHLVAKFSTLSFKYRKINLLRYPPIEDGDTIEN